MKARAVPRVPVAEPLIGKKKKKKKEKKKKLSGSTIQVLIFSFIALRSLLANNRYKK